jgi:hydroxymethylbilane synthase
MKWIIGTRGSQLALRQAEEIKKQMISLGAGIEIKIIKTQGDKITDLGFDKLEGKGFFTKELEEALLDGRVDLAVHSLKDLPTEPAPGLKIAAYCSPEDASEAVLMKPEAHDRYRFLQIRPGACVGTGSVRREAQIKYFRPDLEVKPLRGNLGTRIQKLRDGQYEAILIAKAGLDRLVPDIDDLVLTVPEKSEFLPAPGQGILAIEIKNDNERLAAFLERINNDDAEKKARLERGILARFHGGCRLPLAVHSEQTKTGFALKAFLGIRDKDGWQLPALYEGSHHNIEVLVDMAYKELTEMTVPESFGGTLKVLITRAREDAAEFFKGRLGQLEPIYYPVFQIVPKFDKTRIGRVAANIDKYDWIVFTSKNAVKIFLDILADRKIEIAPRTRIAAVGQRTARLLKIRGVAVAFVPARESGEGLLDELPSHMKKGERVLLPQGEEAPMTLYDGLAAKGLKAERLELYKTVPTPPDNLPPIDCIEIGAFIFTSPLSVKFFKELGHDIPERAWVTTLGSPTAAALTEYYRRPDYIPGKADLHDITDKILEMIQNGHEQSSPPPAAD